jgi:hypothetical protein
MAAQRSRSRAQHAWRVEDSAMTQEQAWTTPWPSETLHPSCTTGGLDIEPSLPFYMQSSLQHFGADTVHRGRFF